MASLIRVLLSCVVLAVLAACEQPYGAPQVTAEPDDEGRAAEDPEGGDGY